MVLSGSAYQMLLISGLKNSVALALLFIIKCSKYSFDTVIKQKFGCLTKIDWVFK